MMPTYIPAFKDSMLLSKDGTYVQLADAVNQMSALLGSIAERDQRITELEQALTKLQKPTMFWDDNDQEAACGDTIHEVLDRGWADGILDIGDERVIQQAYRLENVKVRLVVDPSDPSGFDYDVIHDALQPTEATAETVKVPA